MRKIWQAIKNFRPPLVPVCILAAVLSVAAIFCVATDAGAALPGAALYAVYAGAALFLGLAVWAVVCFCQKTSPGARLHALVHKTAFTGQMADDYSFRTVAFTHLSLGLNILFAVAKGIAGWFSASLWLVTLSVYYLILCVAKFCLLKDSRRLDKMASQTGRLHSEWQAYRLCGALLLFMTPVLLGMVVLITERDSKFTYHGTLIFAVALWDFYNLTMALIYLLRHRGQHTPIVVAIKRLKLATALVSMLSLQTAMFASFGGTDGELKRWMNPATGTAVCVLIFAIGLRMVLLANKNMKENKTTEAVQ